MISILRLFSFLEGTWIGEGRGEFPGVISFTYRETLSFRRRDENSLVYEIKTQKCYDGQTEYLPSHVETGSISLLNDHELQLVSVQKGRDEVLVGSIEPVGAMVRIRFMSQSINNDSRMISSARTFEVEDNTLRYEMQMHTTKVERLTPHLQMTLRRLA